MMVIVSTSDSPSGRSGRSEMAARTDNGEDDATAGTGLSRGSTDSTPSDHHDSRARPQTSRSVAHRPTSQRPWGYEGEQATLTIPIKRTADRPLTDDERTVNALHAATRALAERGNSLLKTTFKALRRVSLCPWR